MLPLRCSHIFDDQTSKYSQYEDFKFPLPYCFCLFPSSLFAGKSWRNFRSTGRDNHSRHERSCDRNEQYDRSSSSCCICATWQNSLDGHTIKTTGKDSSIVLLLSNGTVTTLKADSVLNIKKFTQAKFDPGATKLSELEGEPSASETLIDLNIGDMVVDIKKLDKNFNIESPVGTAGIRGTRIGMNIQQAPVAASR